MNHRWSHKVVEVPYKMFAGKLTDRIQQELDKLLWADLLIFNFPIYWFSTPAILKGWIDRVLVCGICYGGKRFYDQGGLSGKKALVTVTLGGREHMFGEEAIHFGPLSCSRGDASLILDIRSPQFVSARCDRVIDRQRGKGTGRQPGKTQGCGARCDRFARHHLQVQNGTEQ